LALLGARRKIDEDVIVEAVLAAAGHPADEKVVSRLECETRKRVRTSKIHEISFTPDRRILRRPYMRKIMTVEGVTILFPNRQDDPNVLVINLVGERKRFIIETDQVTEDSVVTPKPGESA